jgi:hypothetical protein
MLGLPGESQSLGGYEKAKKKALRITQQQAVEEPVAGALSRSSYN